MAANMWKNSLKNVESDNSNILYENLIYLFYSKTVLTFWISFVFIKNDTEKARVRDWASIIWFFIALSGGFYE